MGLLNHSLIALIIYICTVTTTLSISSPLSIDSFQQFSIGPSFVSYSYDIGGLVADTQLEITLTTVPPTNTTTCYQDIYSGRIPNLCSLVDLIANTQYIVVLKVNQSNSIVSQNATITTPSYLPQPVVSYRQTTSSLVTIESLGGLPDNTTYTVYVNSTVQCRGPSQSNYCDVYLTEGVANYTLQVVMNSAGYQNSTTLTMIIYLAPYGGTFNNLRSENGTGTFGWAAWEGGNPNYPIYYDVGMKYGDSEYVIVCQDITNDTELVCVRLGMVPYVPYGLVLIVRNGDFDPIEAPTLFNSFTPYLPKCDCVNGKCEDLACSCWLGWNGPLCNTTTLDNTTALIQTLPDDPSSVVVITNGIVFDFDLSTIEELDVYGNPVKTINLNTLQWNQSVIERTKYTDPVYGARYEGVSFNFTTFENQTSTVAKNITVMFTQYVSSELTKSPIDSVNIEFAGYTYSMKFGATKYTIIIDGWNFTSPLNILNIGSRVSTPHIPSDKCPKALSSTAPPSLMSGKLGTFDTITLDDSYGNQVFGRLVNRVLLDSLPTTISHTTNINEYSSTTGLRIKASIPYFRKTVIYDPDYSLLLSEQYVSTENDECVSGSTGSNTSSSWKKIVIGVVVGVGGATLAVVVGAVFYMKHRSNIKIFNYKMKTLVSRTRV